MAREAAIAVDRALPLTMEMMMAYKNVPPRHGVDADEIKAFINQAYGVAS